MRSPILAAVLVLVVVVLSVSSVKAEGYEWAIARIASRTGWGISGTVEFKKIAGSDTTNVTVNLSGFDGNTSASSVGIHVHVYGDFADIALNSAANLSRAGGHWNPLGAPYACPPTTPREMGNLGNWDVVGGFINATKEVDLLELTGPYSIIGRALLVHNGTDDCVTPPAGNAGQRIGFGAIGLVNVASPDTQNASASPGANVTGYAFAYFLPTTVAATTKRQFSVGGQNFSVCPDGGCAGYVYVSPDDSSTRVQVKASGMIGSTNFGFHLHTWGDVRDNTFDGSKAGPHWNPDGNAHALPPTADREAGDFGYLTYESDNPDNLIYDYSSTLITNVSTIIGRAFVVHSDTDHGSETQTVGVEDFECSLPATGAFSGAAGARVMVGVVGIAQTNLPLPMIAMGAGLGTFKPSSCLLTPKPDNGNDNGATSLIALAPFALLLLLLASLL